MTTNRRQKRIEDTPAKTNGAAPAAPGADPLAQARDMGQRMLDTTDALVDRVLSGNSDEFLRSSRQQGGQ